MAAADQGLAAWLAGHPHLVPPDVESGESGVALLMLWEVNHNQQFPSQGGVGFSGALTGFTRRLQERVSRKPQLSS